MSATSRIQCHLSGLSRHYRGVYYYILAHDDSRAYADASEVRGLLSAEGLSKDLMVCNERLNRCLKVSKGTRVCRSKIMGNDVILETDETVKVRRGDRVAYVVTGKGEVRGVRTDCEGYVILIYESIGRPQVYEVYIVGEENVREFKSGNT